jgi:hypothetical protein
MSEIKKTKVEPENLIEAISALKEAVSSMTASVEWAEKASKENWFQEIQAKFLLMVEAAKDYQRARYIDCVEGVFRRAIERGEFSFEEIPRDILQSTILRYRTKREASSLPSRFEAVDGDLPF